jgi:Protein of unknown function (DUF5132)
MTQQVNSDLPEQNPNNEAIASLNFQSLPVRLQQTIKDHPIPSVAVGVGIIVATPFLIRLLKPVAKAAIRGGFSFYEKSKFAVAETAEALGDVVAEARAEAAADAENRAKMKAGLLGNQIYPDGQ